MGSQKLCVSIQDTSAAFRDVTTHEYSLNIIRVSSNISPALLTSDLWMDLLTCIDQPHTVLLQGSRQSVRLPGWHL